MSQSAQFHVNGLLFLIGFCSRLSLGHDLDLLHLALAFGEAGVDVVNVGTANHDDDDDTNEVVVVSVDQSNVGENLNAPPGSASSFVPMDRSRDR